MKVLFDVNMPRPLRKELGGHEVITAQSMGWGELENGELIDAAEKAGFNVLVTADKNLRYQQKLADRRIGILVLPDNKLRKLQTIGSKICEALDKIKPGDFIEL
jgi:hypothetical protein